MQEFEHESYCRSDHFHYGYMWDMKMLKVMICCKCDSVITAWPWFIDPLFDILNFLNGYVLGAEKFVIQPDNEKHFTNDHAQP